MQGMKNELHKQCQYELVCLWGGEKLATRQLVIGRRGRRFLEPTKIKRKLGQIYNIKF